MLESQVSDHDMVMSWWGGDDNSDDDGCEHGDYSADSDADSPDTDAG